MSARRRAACRAGALSLVLHAALVAGLYAALARSGSAPGTVGVPASGRSVWQDSEVVALAVPELKPAPAPPQTAPVLLPQPVTVTPAPPVPIEPPPLPRAIIGTLPTTIDAGSSPVAHAPGSPSAVVPAAHGSGVPALSGPPRTATTFFDVPAVGKSVVYVIDRSATMNLDGRLDRARAQVVASLKRLPPDARFQVVAYDRRAVALPVGDGGLAAATPANVAAAVAALEAMTAEGGTDHLAGLRRALLLQPDCIFFLTDEDDLTLADVWEAKRLNRKPACIHALCLVAPQGETPMRALARENGGVFRVVAR